MGGLTRDRGTWTLPSLPSKLGSTSYLESCRKCFSLEAPLSVRNHIYAPLLEMEAALTFLLFCGIFNINESPSTGVSSVYRTAMALPRAPSSEPRGAAPSAARTATAQSVGRRYALPHVCASIEPIQIKAQLVLSQGWIRGGRGPLLHFGSSITSHTCMTNAVLVIIK